MPIKLGSLLFFLVLAGCATLQEESLVGDWQGEVQSPLGDVELTFHFRELDGELECTIDSRFQGAVVLPCGDVTLDEDKLLVEVPRIRGRYRGTIQGDEIVGQWSQAGLNFDFNLERVD